MPARWFICPDKKEIEIKECLKNGCRMKDRCAPIPYLYMVSAEREWKGIPSTTQLISGTMLAFLKLTTDHAIDPDSRAFAVHGTKVHENLSVQPATGTVEVRLTSALYGITGAYDLLTDESGANTLTDHKTWGSFRVAKALGYGVEMVPTDVLFKSGPRKGTPRMEKRPFFDPERRDILDVELQLNMYRILAEEYEGERVDKLKVFCAVRDGGTWMARSRGIVRNTYYIDVAKLRDDVVLRYFRRKRDALLQALERGSWDSVCTPSEHWDGIRCARYCDVAQQCPLGRYLIEDKEETKMPPIDGVTNGPRHLPSLGRIRLGIMVENPGKNSYPKEIDHFRMDPAVQDETLKQDILDAFHEQFGKEPKAIKITLPLTDEDAVLNTWYRRYGSGEVLQCRGDGIRATTPTKGFAKGLEITGKEGNKFVVECNGTNCSYFLAKKCNRRAMLQFLMPSLPGGGTWIISTSSLTSINNILGTLALLRATAGYFDMVEMILERRKTNITFEGKKTVHYPLYLTVVQSLPELLRMSAISTSERFSLLAMPDEDGMDLMLDSTKQAALEAHTQPEERLPEEPVEEPDVAADYAGLVTALGEILGLGEESKKFFDANYTEADIGMFRNAVASEGKARTDLRVALNGWLSEDTEGGITIEQISEITRLVADIPAYKTRAKLLAMVEEVTGVKYKALEVMTAEHAVKVIAKLKGTGQDEIPGM